MRLRTPNNQQAPENIPEQNPDYRTVYKVTTITPILGGGVSAGCPDEEMPIRATAIRGQLRHWWRFLKINNKENRESPEETFKLERDIWGGMGEKNQDFASKIFIKCHVTNKVQTYEYDNHPPQYALFPAREERNSPAKRLIQKNVQFDLIITCEKSVSFKQEIFSAVRWWACFGGIGARTRRGLGAVKVKDINGKLLSQVSREEAELYGCELRCLKATSATQAWEKAVGKLQSFRQGANIARNGQYGRSYWPDADTVRNATGRWNPRDLHAPRHEQLPIPSFPRAMFGLPINFEFKSQSDNGIPPTTQLTPEEWDRMASPLILKPVPNTTGGYFAIALLMPTDHMNDLTLKLKYTEERTRAGQEIINTFTRDEWWATDKQQANVNANKIHPMQNKGSDALTAFMNYFGGE